MQDVDGQPNPTPPTGVDAGTTDPDPGAGGVEAAETERDGLGRRAADRELRFRDALLGAVRDAVVATRADFSIGYWNQAAEDLFGIPAAEALGQRLEDVVRYRFIGTTEASFLRQLARGETFRGDVAFTRPDGTTFTGELTAATMPDPDGSEMGMAVIRDVTAARRTADDSARLAAIVEHAGNLIVSSSPDGVIRSWNPGAEQLLGYGATEMIGRTVAAYIQIDLLPAALALQDRVLGGRERSATAEFTYVARDGARIPVSTTLAAIRDEGGAIIGISAVAQDLRAREALEMQLRQAQKLEAVGRLAGGIAADFNNLLTAVTGYGSLLETELAPGSPAHDDVRQILQAAERATELTRGLLAVSRGRPRELRVVALDPVVTDVLPMLRRLVPGHVETTVSIGSGAGVRIDPTDLELVLVNLVVNAAEAMPDGGQLRIGTRLVDLDCAFAGAHLGVAPGRHAELVVADTGVGMSEDVRAHIFEPYFSTKAGGANPGMGLATVHANVERAGGTIWVTTTPGKGTEFRILFPASEVVPEPAEAPAPPPGGTERVLLVEDEPLVRALATAVLRRGGYQLTVKADPRDAIGVDPDDVDLLVTDVVMPGIAGPILAARLRERRPDLPVLFMSGFVEPSDTADLARLSAQPLLQKPFSPAGLLIAVRSALDA